MGGGPWGWSADGTGRMVRAEKPGSVYTYTYNGDGLLVAETIDGVETVFTWDLALDVPQVLATSDGTRNLYGLERRRSMAAGGVGRAPWGIGIEQGGAWRYTLADALGSVRQWTDPAGAVVGVQSYGPFGEAREPVGTPPWGFTGEWQDPAGMVYVRARWYNPALGRFTQVDPVAGDLMTPATQHGYAYGFNGPLRYLDPTGRLTEKEIMKHLGVSTWGDVLDIFESGPMQGLWGWLKVMREADLHDTVGIFRSYPDDLALWGTLESDDGSFYLRGCGGELISLEEAARAGSTYFVTDQGRDKYPRPTGTPRAGDPPYLLSEGLGHGPFDADRRYIARLGYDWSKVNKLDAAMNVLGLSGDAALALGSPEWWGGVTLAEMIYASHSAARGDYGPGAEWLGSTVASAALERYVRVIPGLGSVSNLMSLGVDLGRGVEFVP